MMKKYFSNIFALAALLMAGAAFTACSSDDNSIEQPANPVGEKTYTLTPAPSLSTARSSWPHGRMVTCSASITKRKGKP